MSAITTVPTESLPANLAQAQPMLRHGDRYTQPDFHRLYEQMPEDCKAELIDGEVYIEMFPLSHAGHGAQDFDLSTWLGQYALETPGIEGGSNSTTIIDIRNEPQPDLLLRVLPEYGGKTTLQDRYLKGPPEWVAEIYYSSVSIDVGRKKRAYERAGIQEYLVWRTDDNELDWWELGGNAYVPLPKSTDGCVESRVFPGLFLDVPAMLRRDVRTVVRRLREHLGKGRHEAFCMEMEKRRAAGP